MDCARRAGREGVYCVTRGVDCVIDEGKGGLCKRGGVDCVRGEGKGGVWKR